MSQIVKELLCNFPLTILCLYVFVYFREMAESHGGLASLTAKLEAAFKKIDKFREDLEVKNIENER